MESTEKTRTNRRTRRLAAGAATLVATLAAAAAFGITPAHAATSPAAVGVYTIKNLSTSMVADVFGASTTPGTIIDAWPYNYGENQRWRFVEINPANGFPIQINAQGDDYYTHEYMLENEPNSDGSPECLQVEGTTPTAGDGIDLNTCNQNSVNELWWPVTVNGKTELVSDITVQGLQAIGYGQALTDYANGDIMGATVSDANNGDNTANAALVLTSDGVQGDQLTLEPSYHSTYGSLLDWSVRPDAYAVDAPTVDVQPLSGATYVYYGCVAGWNPATNSAGNLSAQVTTHGGASAGFFADTGAVDLVDPLFQTASANGIALEIFDESLTEGGSAQLDYSCVPSTATQNDPSPS